MFGLQGGVVEIGEVIQNILTNPLNVEFASCASKVLLMAEAVRLVWIWDEEYICLMRIGSLVWVLQKSFHSHHVRIVIVVKLPQCTPISVVANFWIITTFNGGTASAEASVDALRYVLDGELCIEGFLINVYLEWFFLQPSM